MLCIKEIYRMVQALNFVIFTPTSKWSMDGPHTCTPISVYLRVIFLAPHTPVLCMVSGSATGFFPAVRLVHSLLKYCLTIQL